MNHACPQFEQSRLNRCCVTRRLILGLLSNGRTIAHTNQKLQLDDYWKKFALMLHNCFCDRCGIIYCLIPKITTKYDRYWLLRPRVNNGIYNRALFAFIYRNLSVNIIGTKSIHGFQVSLIASRIHCDLSDN